MSRALSRRPTLRQVIAPACPPRRSRFLSQTAASWQDKKPPSGKINPLTTVFQPGAAPVGKKRDTRDELYGPSLHDPSPFAPDYSGQGSELPSFDYSKVAGTLYASSETADYNLSKPDKARSMFEYEINSDPSFHGPDSDLLKLGKAQSASEYRNSAGSSPYGPDSYLPNPHKAQSSSESSQNSARSLYGQPQPTMTAMDVQAMNESNKRVSESLFGARQTMRTGRSDPAHYEAFDSLRRSTPVDTKVLDNPQEQPLDEPPPSLEPHHLHVYAHKHNCHITFSRPNRDPIISVSCGNIGFRKANRGLFDSAYSLARYVFERLMQKNLTINTLELVLRGYGEGREAIIKLLLSPDGAFFRNKIVRISDSTRLKFGGCRSPGPRRI
ncbi:hypothetical protein CP533_3587 [Ophiocordyceps camponoti-saundersi (nom. inval.)]|nr:hypothetical protein CP533_3587 [Ophiocordyceps camponoti-saundersi (nom. inval.)]